MTFGSSIGEDGSSERLEVWVVTDVGTRTRLEVPLEHTGHVDVEEGLCLAVADQEHRVRDVLADAGEVLDRLTRRRHLAAERDHACGERLKRGEPPLPEAEWAKRLREFIVGGGGNIRPVGVAREERGELAGDGRGGGPLEEHLREERLVPWKSWRPPGELPAVYREPRQEASLERLYRFPGRQRLAGCKRRCARGRSAGLVGGSSITCDPCL